MCYCATSRILAGTNIRGLMYRVVNNFSSHDMSWHYPVAMVDPQPFIPAPNRRNKFLPGSSTAERSPITVPSFVPAPALISLSSPSPVTSPAPELMLALMTIRTLPPEPIPVPELASIPAPYLASNPLRTEQFSDRVVRQPVDEGCQVSEIFPCVLREVA